MGHCVAIRATDRPGSPQRRWAGGMAYNFDRELLGQRNCGADEFLAVNGDVQKDIQPVIVGISWDIVIQYYTYIIYIVYYSMYVYIYIYIYMYIYYTIHYIFTYIHTPSGNQSHGLLEDLP